MIRRTTQKNEKLNQELIEEVDILDEIEQTRIAKDLQMTAITQTERARMLFKYLFWICILIFVICIGYSLVLPFHMQHQCIFITINLYINISYINILSIYQIIYIPSCVSRYYMHSCIYHVLYIEYLLFIYCKFDL
jgi:hypothetical protein